MLSHRIYIGSNEGDKWVELNLDTGAAVTAFPESMSSAVSKGNGNNHETATGERAPQRGQIRSNGRVENDR